MTKTALEQVLREIEELTPQEQSQVFDALYRLLEESKPTPLEQRLMGAGLLRRPADSRQRAEHIQRYDPLELEGELVSETILRERR